MRDEKRRLDKVSGLMDFVLCKEEAEQTENVCTVIRLQIECRLSITKRKAWLNTQSS